MVGKYKFRRYKKYIINAKNDILRKLVIYIKNINYSCLVKKNNSEMLLTISKINSKHIVLHINCITH